MGGFKNKSLNFLVKQAIFNDMIKYIFISLDSMKKSFLLQHKKLLNDEEKIRTHLLENYLNNDSFKKEMGYDNLALRFFPEVPESYDKCDEEYVGRADIKVICPNYFNDVKDYYIIECKRVDGSAKLNTFYVAEGICRFVSEPPKYLSFNGKNIMLAFVVTDIDIDRNISKINEIQAKIKEIKLIGALKKCKSERAEHYLYTSKYECNSVQIELSHIFYDFSMMIKSKK